MPHLALGVVLGVAERKGGKRGEETGDNFT